MSYCHYYCPTYGETVFYHRKIDFTEKGLYVLFRGLNINIAEINGNREVHICRW